MELTIHTPDDVAERLSASGRDLSRRALEAFGLEEYKAGRLSEAQLRQLLGFPTRQELDGFLKAHEVWLNYTVEDLERDRAALKRLGFGNPTPLFDPGRCGQHPATPFRENSYPRRSQRRTNVPSCPTNCPNLDATPSNLDRDLSYSCCAR